MSEQFERDKICYEQHSESFRSLNNQMWQVPIIAMTLTGGLWFGIYSNNLSTKTACTLLFFCATSDILFILILWRVRTIMGLLIKKLHDFNPIYSIDASNGSWPFNKNHLVVTLFSVMLLFSSIISICEAVSRIKLLLCQV
jgi:hypothetical protein